jgi:hypothetical protein
VDTTVRIMLAFHDQMRVPFPQLFDRRCLVGLIAARTSSCDINHDRWFDVQKLEAIEIYVHIDDICRTLKSISRATSLRWPCPGLERDCRDPARHHQADTRTR